jgi:hypothetical protein
LDFLLEENGAYHPRRWQNSYDEQWWIRAVDQLLRQHSMADTRPLGRIWSWKIKLIRIQWGCFVSRSRWATYTAIRRVYSVVHAGPQWSVRIDMNNLSELMLWFS